MRRLSQRTVVITGAAGGIGSALARAFAKEGCRLALVDLDQTRLDDLARSLETPPDHVSTHVVDLSDMDALRALPDAVVAAHGAVHVLINNAGLTIFGALVDQTPREIDRILLVDLHAVIHGCHAFLPLLTAQDEAHIVNVSSLAGFFAMPSQTTYCAVKHGVRGFSRALRIEVAADDVGVTTVMPGAVATRFLSRAPSRSQEFTGTLEGLMLRHGVPPDRLAARVVHAVRRDQSQIIVGWDALIVRILQIVAPWLLTASMRRNWRVYRDRFRNTPPVEVDP